MSHDNSRFNVSGDTQEGLAQTLSLWVSLHGHKEMNFTGYCIDPVFGMVLYIYDGVDKEKIPFPFGEGKNAVRLTSFFYNYLNSGNAKVVDLPPVEKDRYDQYSYLRQDLGWDGDVDHDGDNGLGWRVLAGEWGHIKGYTTPLAIRPIYCWYGK
jgi:hypothetical protein